MRTLYLRNVPDEVVERLERQAKAESTSVNAVAVRELTEVSRRFDNRALFAALPKVSYTREQILEDLDEIRGR
jgi:predicted DNA-binding protein